MLVLSLILCILYSNRFLRLLVENLGLPVYCLVDCDPYGFDILTTYRFGSMVSIYKFINSEIHQHVYSEYKMYKILECIESL